MAVSPVARPAATAWGAVLSGWVATVGASVIFALLAAGTVAAVGRPNSANQLALAAPVISGVLLSYLAGGTSRDGWRGTAPAGTA